MQEHDLKNASSLDMESDEKSTCSSTSRSRVLVRSHAMREEASPPREPSSPMISPSIMVIPSSETSPKTVVVLSPKSLSRNSSPNSKNSSEIDPDDCEGGSPRSKKYNNASHYAVSNNYNNNNNSSKKKPSCDCSNPNCTNCIKTRERNINNNLSNTQQNPNTLSVSRLSGKAKLRQQSSSQGSFDGSVSNSPCLSRDNSAEQYTDTTGIDLELFIPETLNRNAKDRAFMLRIEQELVSLAKDRVTHYKFPPMSSYQRMLVHRCAAYFGMDHNIEASGKCVVVNKTKNTRIPEVEFKEHIKEDLVFSEEPRRSILKRDSNSVEDYGFKSPDKQYSLENRRSKSFEEREEEYEKVRRRIFNREMMMRHMQEGSSVDDFEWAEVPWASTDSDSSRFRLQLPDHVRRPQSKLIKVLSEETGVTLRPYVAKSHSFGGYGGVLTRGDSVVSTHSAGARLLTKQDSGASSVSWRLSPSSSGYKSQSQMSESITPSPTSTPHALGERQDSNFSEAPEKESIVWAVTDMQSVPKGSIIIDPQTGEAIKNEDGTLYHYDPDNPLDFLPVKTNTALQSPQKKSSPIKKRFQNRGLNLINSATSPSLPYSPQLQHIQGGAGRGNFPFVMENLPPPPPQQQLPVFNAGFGGQAQPHEGLPVYQPPCIVYAPTYGVTPQFDNRMETQPSLNECYMNISEVPQSYQPPFWNQQPIYYQNQTPNPPPPPPPPQRFSMPLMPPQNHNFVTPQYQNYLPPLNQPPPPPADLMPYQQLIYQTPQSAYPPPTPQANFGYNQNGVYPIYPNGPYPQAPATPTAVHDANVMQLSQNMSQMNFLQNFNGNKSFDRQKCETPKRFVGGPKNFLMGSSQSSTGTSSPAGTVVAGYCPLYRTPPDTPPIFSPHFRSLNNVRTTTPNRASRSPTPAGDLTVFDRQRMPTTVYHGMPYIVSADKSIPNRAHPPPTYRTFPPAKHQTYSQTDNRQQHKMKKGTSGKMSTMSPSTK